jgi:hypothetical protein
VIVFEDERRRVAAWYAAYIASDGNAEVAQEAERNEILVLRKERDEADERNRLAFEKLIREGEEIKKQRKLEAAQTGSPSILGATGSNGVFSPYSNEEVVHVPENPELREIREKRLQEILSKEDPIVETEVIPLPHEDENTPVPNGAAVPVAVAATALPLPSAELKEGEKGEDGEDVVAEEPKEEAVKWTKFQITEEESDDEEVVGGLGVDVEDIDLSLKLEGEGEGEGEGQDGFAEKVEESLAAVATTTDLYELD